MRNLLEKIKLEIWRTFAWYILIYYYIKVSIEEFLEKRRKKKCPSQSQQ